MGTFFFAGMHQIFFDAILDLHDILKFLNQGYSAKQFSLNLSLRIQVVDFLYCAFFNYLVF